MYTTYKLKLQNRIKCLGFTGNGILTKEYIAKKKETDIQQNIQTAR